MHFVILQYFKHKVLRMFYSLLTTYSVPKVIPLDQLPAILYVDVVQLVRTILMHYYGVFVHLRFVL